MSRRTFLQEYAALSSAVLRLGDGLCVIASSLPAYAARHGDLAMPVEYQVATIMGVLLTLIVFPRAGVYRQWRGKKMLQHARSLAAAWLAVGGILIVIAFTTKSSATFSRVWVSLWVLGGFSASLAMRVVIYQLASFIRKKGWDQARILIIGDRRLGREVAERLAATTRLGVKIVSVIDIRDRNSRPRESAAGPPTDLSYLSGFVEEERIDEVWIASPLRAERRVRRILYALRDSTASLRFVPDVFGAHVLNQKVKIVAGLPVIDLLPSPMVGTNRILKAIEDRVLALVFLLLSSPLIALIAIGVKLSSPGPIIFRQCRQGWDGKTFTLYKFRTMFVHGESDGHVTQARRKDPRVTCLGAFLRRTSLDELPQLVNVLAGHMSLVGPRPHAVAHNEYYKEIIDSYRHRYKVKPGITGWAQVNGFRGETDFLDKMKKRLDYDLYYIENWSLSFDIKIIAVTIFKGFLHRNAY